MADENNSPSKSREIGTEGTSQFDRRKLLKGFAITTAASSFPAATVSADRDKEGAHSTAVLSSVTPARGNRGALVRSAKEGVELVIKDNEDKETILETGDKAPIHPAWNKQGNRLVVSLDGNLWMYVENGEFVQITDSGRDCLAQFDGKDIVFFQGNSAKRISHSELQKVLAGQQNPAGVSVSDTAFKISYATNHPAADEKISSEIRKYNKETTEK
ncbi:hypothetical protein [Natrinema caseinilyticum]|uniref:hypothetical protein n=1 Tax=Natrinema caseinilyticum TaxID=2961570 RepID=UPI0020C39A68|nr:hypothetical protein [Natrinema caseinilyticum]